MSFELKNKLQRIFQNSSVDCIIIVNTENKDPNFTYLTGLKGVFEYDVLFLKKTKAVLLASPLEYENALSQKKLKVIQRTKKSDFLKKNLKSKKVGFNASFIPVELFDLIKKKYKPKKTVDVSKALAKARAIKTSAEIKSIKKAVEITKKTFKEIPKHFKKGVTEKQLAELFDELLYKFGSEENAFKTIVAFGKNTALPHHEPGNAKLKKGDLILIDAGAKFNNYCSDLTRMFTFGEANKNREKIKKMFDCVKKTQFSILQSLKPGVNFKKITKIFENELKKNGFKPVHAFGHSLGVEVHEQTAEKAELNMILAVEPGVYINGVGGVRIEEDILITSKKSIIL
jgi:Xaa-Pro dipeptidase